MADKVELIRQEIEKRMKASIKIEEEFEELVSAFISKNNGKYKRNDGLTPNHNGHLSKRIVEKDKQGNIVCRYESLTVAALDNNVSTGTLVNNVRGKNKTCKGYVYEYE